SGGCDVLDIKEPALGAMGMAAPATIAAVVSRGRDLKSWVPVSVALGEAIEWDRQRPVPTLPTQIAYVKLGAAGVGSDAGWERRLTQVTQRFLENECDAAGDGECRAAKWIAVAYADWENTCGPCPEEVAEGARDCGFAGVLIDTHSKDGRRLFHWL